MKQRDHGLVNFLGIELVGGHLVEELYLGFASNLVNFLTGPIFQRPLYATKKHLNNANDDDGLWIFCKSRNRVKTLTISHSW